MDFSKDRNIKLEGEAFFEVMSDPVNPFTVRSGKVVVSVLGTSFNVKRTRSADEVEVFVTSGRVRVGNEDSPKYMTLEKGEMALIGNGEMEKKPSTDPNYISWKTKEFKFVDTRLTEVLDELAESYHVQIVAEENLIGGLKITTSYREQSIDAILETIATAFGLTVNYRNEAYYLTQ
jgi:ferric-dicitrate binding protein FerR (iron transport regulator)